MTEHEHRSADWVAERFGDVGPRPSDEVNPDPVNAPFQPEAQDKPWQRGIGHPK
jgi:hypothetical protein